MDVPERTSIPWSGHRGTRQPPPSPPTPPSGDPSPAATPSASLHFTPSIATASLPFTATPGGSSGATTTQLPLCASPSTPSSSNVPPPVHSSPHPPACSQPLGSAGIPNTSFLIASPYQPAPTTPPTSSTPVATSSPGLTPYEAGLPRPEDIPDWLRTATHLQAFGPYSAFPEAL